MKTYAFTLTESRMQKTLITLLKLQVFGFSVKVTLRQLLAIPVARNSYFNALVLQICSLLTGNQTEVSKRQKTVRRKMFGWAEILLKLHFGNVKGSLH